MYILSNKKNGTLYVGVTSDLIKRVWEHKNELLDGFTKKFKIHDLVYYELCDQINEAIEREKVLKRWKRKWKIDLIKAKNPDWKDLWEEIAK